MSFQGVLGSLKPTHGPFLPDLSWPPYPGETSTVAGADVWTDTELLGCGK